MRESYQHASKWRVTTASQLLLLATVSCHHPAPKPAAPAANAPAAATQAPAAKKECGEEPKPEDLDAFASAPFDTIELQLDIQSHGGIYTSPATGYAFSRFPTFTLFRDGRVIYEVPNPKPGGYFPSAVEAKLGPGEMRALEDRLRALGLERLHSHVQSCGCPEDDGSNTCVDDAEHVAIRYRKADGTLKHVVVYADFWNDKAAGHAVVDFLHAYRAPGARPYVPEAATLMTLIRRDDKACGPVDPVLTGIFKRHPVRTRLAARALDGEDLRAMMKIVGSGYGRGRSCLAEGAISFTLFPWLPGMDFRPSINDYDTKGADDSVPNPP